MPGMSAPTTVYPQLFTRCSSAWLPRSTLRDAPGSKGESRNLNTRPDTFMPAMPAFFAPASWYQQL